MLRNGRPIVHGFDDDEYLFFRWFRNWHDDQASNPAKISPNQIKPPNQSVNRSGCEGKYWYVLIQEPGEDRCRARRKLCQGVIAIRYENVPKPIQGDSSEYSFRCQHDPIDHNYHHCGIRVFKDDVYLSESDWNATPKKLLRIIKKHYRQEMAAHAELVLRAEVDTK